MKKRKHISWPEEKAKTGAEQFFHILTQLDVILKPSISETLMKAGHQMREEMFQAAIKQLLEDKDLEHMREVFVPLLRDYRCMVKTYQGHQAARGLWPLRPIIRKIIECYGAKEPNDI